MATRSVAVVVPLMLTLSGTPLAAATPEALAEDLSVERLADGVWLHTSWQVLEDFGRVPANGLVVVSEGEAALVDTPWTNDQTARLADWVDEGLGARLTAVVPTHSHVDCMGGLAAAHERGARSWAHERTVAFARRDGLPVPAESFESTRDLRVGSRRLELRFPGPGHTADNIVVWIPDAKVLFGGDVVRSANAESLGFTGEADLEAWPSSVEALIRHYESAALIVPGHGSPGGVELLEHTLELLHRP